MTTTVNDDPRLDQAEPDLLPHGWTVKEVARRYRVSPDKVRAWIRRGELSAVNTASHRCGKPRYVITPDALVAFERGHAAKTEAPKPKGRRALPKGFIDYYPD